MAQGFFMLAAIVLFAGSRRLSNQASVDFSHAQPRFVFWLEPLSDRRTKLHTLSDVTFAFDLHSIL